MPIDALNFPLFNCPVVEQLAALVGIIRCRVQNFLPDYPAVQRFFMSGLEDLTYVICQEDGGFDMVFLIFLD